MKPLLLLLVLIAGIWLWRSRQGSSSNPPPPTAPEPPKPLEMVRCKRCGMHVPGQECVIGKEGSYCSVDHLQQSES